MKLTIHLLHYVGVEMAQENEIHPGPLDTSVLKHQEHHISGSVWAKEEMGSARVLNVRRAVDTVMGNGVVPLRIIPHLQAAGFYEVAKISSNMSFDARLISSMVERWRPETHTFHMPIGECTITFQDVAVLLGLRVDGEPVTGETNRTDWPFIIRQFLGRMPANSEITGNRLRIKWLNENFGNINDVPDGDDDGLLFFARAYIMRLIGGWLLPDSSGSRVPLRYLLLLQDLHQTGRYSWGSAVLGYLYRELCLATNKDKKEIAGCTMLVQLWAWTRIPGLRPDDTDHPILPAGPLGAR